MKASGLSVETPGRLGAKKVPADVDRIQSWLLDTVTPSDALIFSTEMLVHGGLIPSRIDLISDETVEKRLEILRTLKNRGALNYATVTVTRVPNYDNDDEEPDYWAFFGKKLSEYSSALASGDEAKAQNLSKEIPGWVVEDFLWRRGRNFRTVQRCINYVADGVIDYLGITLDDNRPGSISQREAERHTELASTLNVSRKVSVRNGADEALLTGFAKFLTDEFNVHPRFHLVFRFPEARNLVPPYESAPLEDGVRSHVRAVGGELTDGLADADVVLYVNNACGSEASTESQQQTLDENEIRASERAVEALFDVLEEAQSKFGNPKIIGIADVRYANGSDIPFVRALLKKDIDWLRTNYYGWNTAGNTIGSSCAHSVVQYLGYRGILDLDPYQMKKYQATLLIEHYGYQANVRQQLRSELTAKYGRWDPLIHCEKWAENFVRSNLEPFLKEVWTSVGGEWKVDVYFPWHRTFELGLRLS